MRRTKRLLTLVAGVVLVGALPGIAAANTSEAVAETGGMTLMLPGVPATVTVALDDFGHISSVGVDAGFTQVVDSDHKMKFTRDAATDGSTVIEVKAKGDKLAAKVKTSNLGELVGDHTWTADVFGDGQVTTVNFTIAQAGDYLEITSVTVNSPFENVLDGPYSTMDGDDDEDEYESKASVDFFNDGYTKTLKIEVETELGSNDDGDDSPEGPHAKLKVELKAKDRQHFSDEAALGQHTWTGMLCDGSNVAVSYTVTESGITVDGVDAPDGVSFEVKTKNDDGDERGFKVEFTDTNGDSGAYVKAELDSEHGSLELKVTSKTTKSCDDHEDDDDDDHHGDDDHKKKKDDDDDHHGDDQKDHGDDD